jgi:hypothetical protein
MCSKFTNSSYTVIIYNIFIQTKILLINKFEQTQKNQTQNKQKGNREAKISQMRYRRPDVGQGVRTDSSTETCIFSTYQGVRTLTGASGRICRE